MARGPSGRIVIELDPALKRELHSALVADGQTLKDWFRERVAVYLADRIQPSLPGIRSPYPFPSPAPDLLVAEEQSPYNVPKP